MKLRNRKANLTEIVRILLRQAAFFEGEYYPSEILQENKILQYEVGADNDETFEVNPDNWSNWTISFKPDQVFDDKVVEVKVRRKYTRAEDQKKEAFVQALLAAYLLKKPKFEICVINENREVEYNGEFNTIDYAELANKLLYEAIYRFETLAAFRPVDVRVNWE